MNPDNIIPAIICVVVGLISSIVSFLYISKKTLEIKSFKKNAYKIHAQVINYNSDYDSDNGTSYSAIYKYNHPTLGPINLSNNIYYSRKPKIGRTKTIYYNPEYPYKYYNNLLDLYKPITFLLIFSASFVLCGIAILFSH